MNMVHPYDFLFLGLTARDPRTVYQAWKELSRVAIEGLVQDPHNRILVIDLYREMLSHPELYNKEDIQTLKDYVKNLEEMNRDLYYSEIYQMYEEPYSSLRESDVATLIQVLSRLNLKFGDYLAWKKANVNYPAMKHYAQDLSSKIIIA